MEYKIFYKGAKTYKMTKTAWRAAEPLMNKTHQLFINKMTENLLLDIAEEIQFSKYQIKNTFMKIKEALSVVRGNIKNFKYFK